MSEDIKNSDNGRNGEEGCCEHSCGHHDCSAHHEHGAHHEGEEAFDIYDLLPPGEEMDEYTIVMEDKETGEEYSFFMADDFDMDGTIYMVLLCLEGEPEAIFARVVDFPDGTQGFETLDDDQFDRVADYYAELCEQSADGEFDDDFDDEYDDEDDDEDEE